ncbi:nucleophile aminohydrolase [Podospora fimiseda]|uniref:Nucleophile aminohydrolase n=1 Tax=Podospora fimiseda TaxID=252190 RepID=A0AAN7H5L1_9PEZI|nr:nucleophile aminohydrolase [Podospora fimiseda]
MHRSSSSPQLSPILSQDGAVDRVWRKTRPPVASIFIHAGAGYHSLTNEKVHLEACSEAARIGIRFLKAGASATEAVEAAIKSLEDKEITNAGFGSNLNMDGVVECDATIVDHLGRSGACGAVPGIKNPISLAKMILDASSQPLSLRRVPPNILVGIGAKEFAEEHGMNSIMNENLTSKNAKDRFLRWSEDLKRAEAKLTSASTYTCNYPEGKESRMSSPGEYEKAAIPAGHSPKRDHTSAILTGTWNEGQPDSPCIPGTPLGEVPSARSGASSIKSASNATSSAGHSPSPLSLSFVSNAFQSRTKPSVSKRPKVRKSVSDDVYLMPGTGANRLVPQSASGNDGSVSADTTGDDLTSYETYRSDSGKASPAGNKRRREIKEDIDLITDTVGAIAVDLKGRIAAGSSSGGIGMKHRGRIGPAALVGIGTAIVPEDSDDDMATSVAAVTSGTGEHMATSMASAKCAERLFHNTRRGPGGRDMEELDEHTIMDSFVLDDFMGHPGVRSQPSAGAIGVMAVKKDRTGVYFYFAHNTDSFALASMSSTEREPLCVMSRLGKAGPVAQGGRKVRVD